jgi:hypothetical protein
MTKAMLNKALNSRPRVGWRLMGTQISACAPTFWPLWGSRAGGLPASRPLRADCSHRLLPRQVNVPERERHKRSVRILCQAPVAHLGKTPQALDNGEHMLDPWQRMIG